MDDYDDDDLPWFETGTAYDLSGQDEPPRFRSLSPNAHRAIQIGKAMARVRGKGPIGFHRPPVR